MSLSQIILTVFGFLLLTGAYFGWKAKSQISLFMGLISGVIVLMAVYLTRSNPQLGFGILAALSALLSVTFLSRLIKTKKAMPSGMLFFMSLVATAISIKNFLNQ